MGFRLSRRASLSANQVSSKAMEVPKGYLTLYIGDVSQSITTSRLKGQ